MNVPHTNELVPPPVSQMTPELESKMREYAMKVRRKYESRFAGERLVKIVTRETLKKFKIKLTK